MRTFALINKLFPDWMSIAHGEWSKYPLELTSAGSRKFFANLYREPAKNEEYAGTLTFQMYSGDDVAFCEKIDIPLKEFLDVYMKEIVTLDLFDEDGNELSENAPLQNYLVKGVVRKGDTFEVTVTPDTETKREFYVETPLGLLKVFAKHKADTAADFPGVFVDLVTPGFPEGDCLACVEYDSNGKYLQTCVYQPGEDEPVSVVVHDEPNLARIEYDTDGKTHYYDSLGNEILHRMLVRYDDGTEEIAYRADNGELGIDATNPVLIQKGKANPCEYGICPFTEDDLREIVVVMKKEEI